MISKYFKEIKTFPHHKHLQNEVTECSEPELNDILSEIEINVLKNFGKVAD